jgi:lipopolysaccharide/colanic/teichoic acid biosynthesis glycosyltransferase
LTDAAYPVPVPVPVPHPVLVLVKPRPRLARRTILAHAIKRVLDVVVASLVLLVSIPVLLLSVVAISLTSRGAPIFVQERVGKDGRHFRFYKLRTMVAGNDDTVQVAWAAQWVRGGGFNGLYKLVNDHRITRVGRFLRRYSIDELPQMWNVIRGDMSLVGPRPALPHEVAMYDDTARRRLSVKPGVTGLWQVSGRSELSFPEMIALDLHYATWWSLRSDLRILLRTPLAAISARGAV